MQYVGIYAESTVFGEKGPTKSGQARYLQTPY